MIPSQSYFRVWVAVNIMALAAFYTGHYDLGAVILYAGLCNFQTYLVTKKYEELTKDNK